MAVYSIDQLSRREILTMSAVLAGSALAWVSRSAVAATLPRTPDQILGPFYPLKEMPKAADLTRVPGRNGRAAGQILK